jgi:N-methylhydantoinase B/oxoprolinase/acetone carboxylase alpha subunit
LIRAATADSPEPLPAELLPAEPLPAKTSFDATAGDILQIHSPGGGGWGTPPD